MSDPTKWHVCPAKTQNSLGICPVWSESLLSAWRKLGSLASHWAHSKGSDQTGLMPRLIWVWAGSTCCTCHFVGFGSITFKTYTIKVWKIRTPKLGFAVIILNVNSVHLQNINKTNSCRQITVNSYQEQSDLGLRCLTKHLRSLWYKWFSNVVVLVFMKPTWSPLSRATQQVHW